MSKHKISIIIGCAVVIAIVAGGTAFASELNHNEKVHSSVNAEATQANTTKPTSSSNSADISKPSSSSNTTDASNSTSNLNTAHISNSATLSKNNSTDTRPHVDNMQTSGMPGSKNTTPTSTNSNAIKIINYSTSQTIEPNDLIVENTTGNPISDTQLLSVIKNWILTQQYSYSGFADANGTMWSEPWLNNIPSDQLIDYFTEANGQAALSQNITAQELNKTAVASLAFAKAHPNPFSQAQTDIYIKQMLNQSDPNQTITQIVFHGNNSEGGDYYVYTKQRGTSEPFWYVESWIGYPTGI